MCVALPGRVTWIGEATEVSIPARIDLGDRTAQIDLVTVPDAVVGDYVIAHSGYAVRRVDPEVAAEVQAGLQTPRSRT